MILEYINFKNNIMNFTEIKRLGNTYYHTSTFEEVESTLKEIRPYFNDRHYPPKFLREDEVIIEPKSVRLIKRMRQQKDVWEIDYEGVTIGKLTTTVGKKGFSFHFNYTDSFISIIDLCYFNLLCGYYIKYDSPFRIDDNFKMRIFEIDRVVDSEVRKRIKSKILPFINRCIKSEITDYTYYSQFKTKTNSLLLSKKIYRGNGIYYRNFKENLNKITPIGETLYNFIDKISEDDLVQMINNSHNTHSKQYPNMGDVLTQRECEQLENFVFYNLSNYPNKKKKKRESELKKLMTPSNSEFTLSEETINQIFSK